MPSLIGGCCELSCSTGQHGWAPLAWPFCHVCSRVATHTIHCELQQACLMCPVCLAAAKQVLYLDVRPDDGLEQLTALAAATRAHFKDAGLLLQADQLFVPHGALTLSDSADIMPSGTARLDC